MDLSTYGKSCIGTASIKTILLKQTLQPASVLWVGQLKNTGNS